MDQPLKVVLFCGGQGLRLREYDAGIPKPMAPIGLRPVLWHVMRYYSSFGHKNFVLCLGHKGEVIKDYFLRYSEALSNDFVLVNGGKELELLSTDIEDWRYHLCRHRSRRQHRAAPVVGAPASRR